MQNNKNTGKMKLLYMIFSIAVSIALWTYVVYVENPLLDNPYVVSNVPVEFTNADLLRDNNLVVSDIDVRQLTVYFGGRYRDVTKLSNMNVRAVVDLTDVLVYTSPTGTHSLDYDLIYDNSGTITVEDVSRPVIEVTIDKLKTAQIVLTPVYTGGYAEGYMGGDLTLSRETVDISGTEAAINKIAKATVTLNRENLSRTASDPAPIVLLDEDGNVLDPSEQGLTFVNSDGTALITQKVLMYKELPLVIDVIESPTAMDSNISIEYSPKSIQLSGDPEVLEEVNSINLGTVDLKSFELNFESTYQIKIPNNTTNLSNISQAQVKISVLGMSTKRLSSSNITYINAAETDYVSIITQALDITLRGTEADLGPVTGDNVRIVANLSNYSGTSGVYMVPASVYVDGVDNKVEAVGDYRVSVTITQ